MEVTVWLMLIAAMGGVVLFFCGLMWTLAHVSGWRQLAADYPANELIQGQTIWTGSVLFGWLMGYNNGVIMTANGEGLRLSLWPLIRIGHPPIFLPWSEMQASASNYLWLKMLRIRMDRSTISFRIPAELVSQLRAGLELPIQPEQSTP